MCPDLLSAKVFIFVHCGSQSRVDNRSSTQTVVNTEVRKVKDLLNSAKMTADTEKGNISKIFKRVTEDKCSIIIK